MNYKEALHHMEEFMTKSLVRDFCVKFCKGKCCNTLYYKCRTMCNERKLSCSTYICPDVTSNFFEEGLRRKYYLLRDIIMSEIKELTELHDGRCIYGDVVDEEVKKSFYIPDNEFLPLLPSEEELCQVKNKLKSAIVIL